MKRTFLHLIFLLTICSGAQAGERYWVGGGGNWSDPKHWSEKSGGIAGASIPTSVDNVTFDSRSLLGDGEGVFIDGKAQCHNMIWKEISSSPILIGSALNSINIFGSLSFAPKMANQFKGKFIFKSSEKGNTITSANHFFYGDLVFEGAGDWKFNDDIRTKDDASVVLISGSLNTNSKNIFCNSFITYGEKNRSLLLGSSDITVRDKWDVVSATNFSFDAGSSKIILPKEKNNKTFVSGNLKYNDVSVTAAACSPSGNGCAFFTITITSTQDSCNGGACNGTVFASIAGGTSPFSYLWDDPGAQTTALATGLCTGTYLVQVEDGLGNTCVCFDNVTSPPTLNSLPLTSTPATCNGVCNGTATASPFGGVSPYTYLWSPSSQTTSTATGLCGGITHSVTITDSYGCTVIKTRAVTQPPALVPNGASTSLACFNVCTGTASVAPSGGTSPYSYSWSPGGATTTSISNLCAGNYTCTITDANSCTNNYTTTITQPPQLTTTVTGTNLSCNAVCTGSVTASSSGGTGAYTYSWAPGGCTTSACTGLCAGTYTLTLSDANGCTVTSTVTLTQPSAITTTPTGTNITCFAQCDGTVNANAGGGTSPYTYLWSPGGCTTSSCSNLCAGTYTVNVNDVNGCPVSGTVTLTQPATLTITPTKVDIICPGLCNGVVSASVSGGTAPYTYAWSPGGCTTSSCSNLCSGTYSVTVTDSKGCIATTSVTVNMPSPLVPNASVTNNASCFATCDGAVTSAATGGTPPYTYSWAPGGATTSSVSGLCAGNYTLTLMDSNGCPSTETVTITQPGTFTASISSATPNPLNCNGDCNGTAATTVGGGTPTYSYLWTTGATTPGVSGLCAGVYSVTVTDANGCTAAATVTFLQPTTLTVTITSSNPTCNSSCDGSISAVAGGGTPGYTFAWLPGGQTASTIASQCAGTFTLTTTDSKGCSNTQTITLTDPGILASNTTVINNVSCSGLCDGSANSTPTGGTAPFTYAWSDGQTTSTATGLCVGTLSVTVTDANGCVDIDIVTITQPTVLSSSISSSTSSCTLCNGTASVTTSGGTTPYTFLWSNGQTTSAAVGLCVGTYTVDITDANGCTNSVTATINPVVTLTLTVSGSSVSCFGSCDGIATATPFGGGAPYTYSWSTVPVQTTQSATGLCAGTYSVTVGDFNGCISTATLTLTNPPVLSTAMSSVTASCGVCNGSATATPAGGTGGYTYTWSGFPVQTTATATGLCSGNYTVTVADANNCTTTNTVSVGNIPAISDNASVTLATCGGSDGAICISPSGGSPGYFYLWSPGGATTNCITGLAAGIDTVIISDSGGCSATFAIAVGNVAGPTITVNSQIDPTCNASCDGSISITASGGVPGYNYLWNPGGQTTTAISAQCAGTYIIQVDDAVPCTSFASVTLVDPPQLSSNPVIVNVLCSGGNTGNICLSPTGGTSPYNYQWLPGGQTTSCLSSLTAGTYSVVVTDATGCDDTVAIPVTEPAPLNITISSTNVTCNGSNDGTATATVTGGTTLYTYLWSTGAPLPTIVGLAPGNYTVGVMDANGCIATATVAITEPAALTSTITSTNVTCNALCDGTAALSVSGGTTAYTYSWLPGGETTSAISALCNGNYVVNLSDANGCANTQSVTITQPAAVSASVATTNASCFSGCDGTATASASGGTGAYTYSWSPSGQTTSTATGLCAGSYTLTTTDANGCATNNLFSITEPAQLQANITNTPPLCTSGCDGTATSAPVGGTGSYTYSWSNGQTTATATGLCAGTYTLSLSDGNGCNITQTTNVLDPPPLTQANGVAGATCMLCNGSITIIASGGTSPYSFFWNTGATTATVTGLCAGVYIDTVMDANGCIVVDTIGVSNTSGPVITVNSTSVTCNGACDGTGTVATATGDGPPWVYSWFPFNQTTQTVTGLCPLQYFVSVTDTLGCVTVDNINIVEPAALADNPTITNATCFGICNGSITLAPTGGVGAYTYNWMPGGLTTQNISSQCAGTYTLTLTDANNCVLTSTLTIGQNTVLTSTVTSTNSSCNSSCDGTATVVVGGGTMPYSYLWTSSNQTTTTATGLCAGTQTMTATDLNGCIRIDSAVITQPNILAAGITAVNPLCNTSCDGLLSSSPTGGTPPYTYLWSNASTTTSITGLCAGTYTLDLTDANNCASTTTITLTNPPALANTFTVTNASCSNTCDGAIDITPSGGTGAYTFIWSPGGQTTEDVTGLCPGIDSVTITDGNGCAATYSMTVGVITLVTANAGADQSFCAGGTATMCETNVNATSFGWYNITSGWTFIGSTTCINQNPPVGVTSYGLIAMNGICSDTDTVAVTVNAYPVLVSSNDTTSCAGDSITLCSSNANNYQWYTLPAWTPLATGSCITVAPAVGNICYGIIGMNGICSDTDTVCVTVLAMPIANAGSDVSFCAGGSTQLCDTLSLNGVVSIWYQLPAWTPVDTDSCVTVSPIMTTDFAVIVSNGICSDTDTVSVTIFPLPVVDAGTSTTILSTSSTQLSGTGNGTYLWSPATGLSSTTISNPTANPTVTTTYTLTVTDTSGCVGTDTVRITIISDVVPNDGLSPNGDGINDIWEIPNIESFPGTLVEVYNRWGELLFTTTDYMNNKWNAKYNGKELPVGTYYYVINLFSDLHPDPITGPITILR